MGTIRSTIEHNGTLEIEDDALKLYYPHIEYQTGNEFLDMAIQFKNMELPSELVDIILFRNGCDPYECMEDQNHDIVVNHSDSCHATEFYRINGDHKEYIAGAISAHFGY